VRSVLVLLAVAGALSAAGRAAVPPNGGGARTDLMRKSPYLIWPGDPTRMEVLWQLSATGASTIEWGPDTTCALGSAQTSEYGNDHQHTWTITDLTPGTLYYYRVRAGGPAYPGSFHAAPPPDQADVKFFAYGDTRSNPAVHDQVAGAMIAGWDADPEYQSVALVVGDLVYHGDLEADWTDQYFSPAYSNVRSFLAHLPYHSCIGNHEGTGTLFVKYFPYPFVGGRYWSYDYGPMHVTVIDQYTSYGPGSAQLQWIASDLAASAKPWKFIVLHAPGWSAGDGHENNVTVQTYIQPLCVRYGVSIVFGGHNHYYARAEVDGVEHITTGGGGAPLYTPNPSYPHIVATARAYHFCRISIQGGELSFEAVTPQGVVIDSFTLAAPASAASAAASPAPGRAQPNPFCSATVIHWGEPLPPGAHLRILDPAGRQVRTLALGSGPDHAARWDATDDLGRRVDTGLYFFRPEPATSAAPGKVLIVR
jgi:hypothetical protein